MDWEKPLCFSGLVLYLAAAFALLSMASEALRDLLRGLAILLLLGSIIETGPILHVIAFFTGPVAIAIALAHTIEGLVGSRLLHVGLLEYLPLQALGIVAAYHFWKGAGLLSSVARSAGGWLRELLKASVASYLFLSALSILAASTVTMLALFWLTLPGRLVDIALIVFLVLVAAGKIGYVTAALAVGSPDERLWSLTVLPGVAAAAVLAFLGGLLVHRGDSFVVGYLLSNTLPRALIIVFVLSGLTSWFLAFELCDVEERVVDYGPGEGVLLGE